MAIRETHTSHGMNGRMLFWESWQNITSGTTHAVRYAVILAILVVATALADILPIRALIDRAEEFRQSGAATLIYSAPNRIDPLMCDRFADVHGVVGAGATRSTQPITALAYPGARLPVFEVTPGFMSLFDVTGEQGNLGVVMSADAAEVLDALPGRMLATDRGNLEIAGIYTYPDDGRRSGFGYAILAPISATTSFDECWVETWPPNDAIMSLLPLTLRGHDNDSDPPTISQLNSIHGRSFNGYAEFLNRPLRYAPVLAGIAAGILGFASIRARRLELAAAQHIGVTRKDQILQILIETISWIILGVIYATPILVYFVTQNIPTNSSAALFSIVGDVARVAIVSTIAGAVLSTALIREAHLFTYFKNR